MKKQYGWLMLLLLISLSRGTGQSEVDSLSALLKTRLADTARIDILLSLSNQVASSDRALDYIDQALQLAEEKGLKIRQALALKSMGIAHYRKGDYLKALESYNDATAIYREINHPAGISNMLNNIGAIYHDQGDDAKALEFFLEALRNGEEAENTLRIGTALMNVGLIYMKKPQTYEQSAETLKRAVSEFKKINYQIGIGVSDQNLGELYLSQEKIDSALFYLEQSRERFRELGIAYYQSSVLNLIGQAHYRAGDLEAAIENQQEAVRVAETEDSQLELGQSFLGLADTYKAMKNNAQALTNYFRAEQIFTEMGIKDGLLEVYQGISEVYEDRSDFNKALYYQQLYSNYKDTLYNIATADEIKTMSFSYEMEKKEAEIENLNTQNQLQETEIRNEKMLRNFFITLAAFLLIVGAGVVIQFRIVRKNRAQKQALDHQNELNENLRQIDRLKDQILANTSHELRTPLNGIIGLADSLIDGAGGPLPAKAVNSLEMIVSSGRRLAHLVNDILDFSKIKNADIQLQLRPIDLYAVVDVIFRINAPLVKDKDLRLINDFPEDLPAVLADENRLQQILYNLVGNAIKFTPEGEVRVYAKLINAPGDQSENPMIEVSVADTGIGIPEEKLGQIFQEFEQADGSISREYGGSGLGLSISQRMVELHGGRMWVTSKTGEGSTFFFTLPASDEKTGASVVADSRYLLARTLLVAEPQQEIQSAPDNGQDRIKVLVVDDEPINQEVLKNYLSGNQYELTHAMDGEEAIQALETKKFDLVLLDVMMPKMSGYEVCRKIREKYLSSELPVIMVTAKNQVQDLVQGFDLGANDYLAKPFSKPEFLARVKTQINLHHINRATGRFVPNEFLRSLGRENITEVMLGDHAQREVTVFFSDIREYTGLAEQMTPEENFRFVNAFNSRMGPVIKQHHGFINQYLGDGIMAIFPNSPEEALRAAVDMQLALQVYNLERAKKDRAPLKVGMGMHSGPLIMGIIGDKFRMDAATIADTVNIASRVESLTKYFGVSILLSRSSLDLLPSTGPFDLRYLGEVIVKGKGKQTGLYECYSGDEPEIRKLKDLTLRHFEKALQLFYDKEFEDAAANFRKVAQKNPSDLVAKYYYHRSVKLARSGVPENWTGIEIMTTK